MAPSLLKNVMLNRQVLGLWNKFESSDLHGLEGVSQAKKGA